MANSPSIVMASLSDDQLKKSIDSLVTHVDEAMKKMVQSTNNAVGEMEAKLKSLGNLKIDSGGTADGGASKRAKAQNAETDAVEKNVAARDKQIKKNQEVKMSFDQMQTALEKATRLPSEMRMPDMAKSARESFQAFYKGFNEQARKLDSLIKAEDNRLASAGLGRFSSETQAQLAKVDASIDQTRWKMNFLYQEEKRLNQEALRQKVGSVGFEQAWLKKDETKSARVREGERLIELEKERQRIIASDPTVQQLDRNIEQTRAKIQQLLADEKRLHSESLKQTVGSSEFERLWNQKYQARDQRIAEQEKLIQLEKERQNLVAVDPIRTQLANVDELRAKHEKVLGVMRDETITNNKVAESQQQVTSSTQQSTQAAQRYTEEIRKQLAAITSKKDATKAFEQISIMPSNTMDEIKAKGQALVELVKKVKDTPLMSQSNVKLAEKMIGSLANQYRALKEEKEKVANTQTINATAENTTRRSLEQEKQDLERLKALQEERRQQIIQTGIAAQQQARILRESIGQQMQSADYTKQVDKVKELQNALTEMKNAYKQPIDSSIKKSLEEDIAITQKALDIAKRYNMTVAGLGAVGVGGKAPTDTLAAYSAEAQRLAGIYKNLSTEERSASAGQGLKRKYQELSRTASQVRKELERPINLKDAMKGGESTIDDLAYKIQRLQSYKRGLDFKTQAGEIQEVDNKIKSLNAELNKYLATAKNVQSQNTALGRSWNYMKNRLAFYFTVGASTQFVKNLIEVRSQYEMNERALGILIDSAERGTRIFNELSQMALVSPYTLIELSTAAKQLTAYDVAAKDVVDTTRRLADMAAAVGIPIERLTYALGQIKAYGYLNARDARMFSNAGIPLVKQLAEHYTELEGKMVSTADVYDRIKKKAIDMTDVMQVINKMTDEGGKFFDFQAKMAGTLKVQLANLTLAWNNMLNDIGASEQGTISTGIGLLKELFLEWKNISKMVTNLAIGFGVVKAAQLAYYGVVMGTNKAIALETVLGNRLSNNLRSLTSSMNAARMSSTALWVGIATFAAAAVVDILRGNEAMKEFNKTLRENAENTYNDLKKFSENYSGLRESLYKTENGKQTPVDINNEEAKKAWEVLREQIELSSHASDEYISKLLSIENVSERLRQGFAMIESIQSVSAAIKELGDDTIKLERDWSAWWNLGLLPDGTIGNLQDAYMWLSKIEEKYGSVVNARKVASTSRTDEGLDNVFQDEAKEFVENYETELEKFREDLQVTKQSIIDFIELKGWSGDTSKINEAFKTFTDNLILKNQLNPQHAYTLQLEMEEARSKAAKQALLQRINDERAALKISHDDSVREALAADIERYKNWDETNGRSKVEWERFTKWLKEQHISETTAMFRNMDAEDIRSLNFQEGKHAEWVKRMVTQYAKEHKMSYDDAFGYLKSWVTSANQWSIFIPMTISTEDSKTVYKQLGEYDKAVDEADAQIERLTKRINELNAKKKKSKEETKELANAERELTQAQKDKADAEAKGGHGKKEKKDEKAANKAAKQAESELAKALKEELSTIEKVRSIYKDLTKEGMSHADAVERATRGWGETVNAINKVLQKNGLQKLDLSKFAGIENPRELVNMLQSQLNTLLKRGAKPAEIKELQTKVNTLEVDADKYDLTKITKGLNNELGKLKDEYELAVELDANPELGGMFLDMFGIDPSSFSHNIDDYMFAVQSAFEKARRELGYGVTIDVFKANDEEWEKWGEWVGLSGEALDNFKARFVSAQGVAKKWATDVVNNTKKLEYELAELNDKIAIKEKEQALLHEKIEKEKNEATKHYLELTYQSNEKAIGELRAQALSLMPEYARVFNSIAEYSAGVSRRLQRDLMRVFDEAKYDSANKKWTLTGSDGKQTILNDTQYRKEREKLTKEMRKSQSPFNKIKEAFKPSDKNGVVDYAKGIELISEEVQKLGSVASEVGNLAQIFGADEQTVEIINDVATSLNGVATAGQGISQIASGDYIGGAASVLSGITSIIGAWADNGNKKIDAEIKESELAVKRLENQYKKLQAAVEDAYGTMAYAAEKAAVYNKKLQLEEMKRQLRLEQSRSSKDRDDERIESLKGEIIDLEQEIKNAAKEIVNDMLGITSVGDAAEQMVMSMINAFRQGEDYMAEFDESFEDMIDNMIMKSIVSRIIGARLESIWDEIDKKTKQRGEKAQNDIDAYVRAQQEAQDSIEYWQAYLNNFDNEAKTFGEDYIEYLWGLSREEILSRLEQAKRMEKAAQEGLESAEEEYAEAIRPQPSDVSDIRATVDSLRGSVKDEFEAWMEAFGVSFGDRGDKNLSALQQGIQGVTEDTAGALEGYMNGVSQQVYLHSDLLTQIRDAVVGFDMNASLGVQAQMLLQLQQSYAVQMAIQGILEGVLNPSGRAFSVELVG